VSRELVSRSISETAEAARALKRKIDAEPKREDYEREFGKDKVKDEGNGSWSLSLKEREDIKRAVQMTDRARHHEIERGEQLRAKSDGKREKVMRRDGRVIEIREDLVDSIKHRVRPVGRNGGAPSLRFGLNQAFGKYEQGPDGLWFVWNDGWEPTNLFNRGALSPQRDPEGNVWVKDGDEWVLMDEVA
jgi:hypothetical protein